MSPGGAPPCPLCRAASSYLLTATDRNRRSTAERFVYMRCDSCATVFLADPPEDLGRYYVSDYHGFHADGEPRWRSNPEVVRYQRERAELVLSHAGPGRLIDIGAGPGAFAAAAKQAGFDVTAIEMDAGCCEYLQRGLGVRAVCSDQPIAALSELAPARAIILWHVLEHLSEPAEMLAACSERLEPGGVLAVGLPNPESIQFRLLRERWVHLDAPRHVCLAPADALIAVGREHALKPVELTTDDAVGRSLNGHGWVSALQRHPDSGGPSKAQLGLGLGITLALAPLERRRLRGAGYTLLLQKDDGEGAR